MRKRSFAVGVVGLSLIAGACGGSSSSGGGIGGTDVPISEVPARYADAVCNIIDQCLGQLGTLFLGGADCRTLIQKQVEQGEFGVIEDAIADGRVVYNGNLVEQCVSEMAALGCDAFVSAEPEACVKVAAGTVAEGGSCTLDAECEGRAFCKVETTCPGTCTALLDAGDTCSGDDECGGGLSCIGNRCVLPGDVGSTCTDDDECRLGTLCVGADAQNGTPGTCKDLDSIFSEPAGSSCDLLNGVFCQAGSVCAVDEVVPELVASCQSPVAPGGECAVAVPSQCPTGQFCDVPTDQWQGTCVPLPTDGQPCTSDGQCAASHVCLNGTCDKIGDLGASCTDASACFSESCDSGECTRDLPCPQ